MLCVQLFFSGVEDDSNVIRRRREIFFRWHSYSSVWIIYFNDTVLCRLRCGAGEREGGKWKVETVMKFISWFGLEGKENFGLIPQISCSRWKHKCELRDVWSSLCSQGIAFSLAVSTSPQLILFRIRKSHWIIRAFQILAQPFVVYWRGKFEFLNWAACDVNKEHLFLLRRDSIK